MTAHRWIVAGLTGLGALAVAAGAAGLMAQLAPAPGWLAYTAPADARAHALTLRAAGPNVALLETATGTLLESRPLASTLGVRIQGAAGAVDDALTVDLSGGPLALPQGIHFDGGAGGDDTLLVMGGAPVAGSYTATGPQAGVVTEGDTRVLFSNLEPFTDTIPATNYVVNVTAGNDNISITNGGSCGILCTLTKVSSPTFESVAFADKMTVTINGLAGADNFTLNNSLPATSLTRLVLDAGGNPGDVIGLTSFNLPGGTLRLTNAVTVTQSGGVTAANLSVRALARVSLGNFGNQVNVLAGQVTQTGGDFFFASSVPTFTVGSVDGLAGVTTLNGSAVVEDPSAGGTLVISQPLATGGGDLSLFADHMALNAAVNVGAGIAYLDNETFSTPISLGTKSPATLGLLQAELNRITAGILQIGDFNTDTGGLTVTADITAPAGWSTLDLRQNAAIEGLSPATLSVPNLALRAFGGDVFFEFNEFGQVHTLAGATHGSPFTFRTSGPLTIGTVAGVSGVSTQGGDVSVETRAGSLTAQQPVLSGAGKLALGADESASPTDDVIVNPGVVISSTANDVELQAGDAVRLLAGSRVAASGAGRVLITFSASDTDNLGGGTLAGTVDCATHIPQVSGGNADETLLVDFQAGAALPEGIIYDGGPGFNQVTETEAGSSAPHQFNAAGTGTARDLGDLVHFSRVQQVTLIGGNAADAFDILPDAGVAMHVVGGLPGGAPGDALFIDLVHTSPLGAALAITGHDATGAAGQWTFSNRQPVSFTGIDTFANLSQQLFLPLLRR